jgi:hypothetical protein
MAALRPSSLSIAKVEEDGSTSAAGAAATAADGFVAERADGADEAAATEDEEEEEEDEDEEVEDEDEDEGDEEEERTWVSWFCGIRGNEVLVAVDAEFASDECVE